MFLFPIFLSSQPFSSALVRSSPPRDFSLSLDMENTNIQPEDVRVPSADSSPTQVPPDDIPTNPDQLAVSNYSDTHAVDPALLPSLPRSDNQYNEDYTDYARQVHNPAYGSWPVSEPFEEWACRQSGQNRYWFYRAWFHHQTLFWDHQDLEYYKSATGYFIDTHPASHWPTTHYRVWGTRGWQLVLSATQSLSMWTQCEKFEAELRAEEERLAAAHNPTNQFTAEAKSDRLWIIWSISMYSIKLKPSCGISLRWTSLRFRKINSSEGSSTPSLRTRMNFSKLFVPMILHPILTAPPQPPLLLQGKLLRPIPSGAALDSRFPYLIRDLCH